MDAPVQIRSAVVRTLQRGLPFSQDGLPKGIYRADLIDPASNPQDDVYVLEDQNAAAFMELSYEEGFPALPDGRPFWFKMEFEPSDAFNAFQQYVDLGNHSPRSMTELLFNPEMISLANSRNQTEQEFQSQLLEWYHTYYWKLRTRAHDLYKEAAYRHIRVRRATNLEENHFQTAQRLYKKVMDVFEGEGSAEKFWDALTPKEALDFFKTVVQLQRISVGLPAAGPSGQAASKEGDPITNFEMQFRQIAKRNTATDGAVIDVNGNLLTPLDGLMKDALDDPESSQLLQEIIIRQSSRVQGKSPDSTRPALTDPAVKTDHEMAEQEAEVVSKMFGLGKSTK